MNKLLNKNFIFLNDEGLDFKSKQKVIEEIINIHKNFNEKKYNDCIAILRKVSEAVINDRLEEMGIDNNFGNLVEKIEIMKKHFGKSFKSEIQEAFHTLRIKGNNVIHELHYESMKLDVMVCLHSIHQIIIFLFANNKNEVDKFDDSIYYNEKNHSNLINMINKEDDKLYKPIDKNKNFFLEKEPLINWMTLNNRIIMIPIYQRGYTWEIDQIETLFNDILNRMEDDCSHYFGIIAGKNMISLNNLTSCIKIKIIDGQQRLTTSFLFICAIREVMKKVFDVDIKEEKVLSDILKLNDDKNKIEDYFYNPGGTIDNNIVFRSILSGKLEDIPKASNIYNVNFEKFQSLIKNEIEKNKWDLCKIRDLLHTFITKFELANISFDSDKITNKKEMEIFENLNSKGKQLETNELIKNYIFNLCSENLLEKEGDKNISIKYNLLILQEVNNKPEDFFKILTQYSKGTESANNRQIQLNDFKDTIITLFDIKPKEEINRIEDYENLLKRIKAYATIYSDVIFGKKIICKWLGIEEIITLCDDKKKVALFLGLIFLVKEYLTRNGLYKLDVKLKESIRKEIWEFFLILMKAIIKNSIVTGQGDSNFKRKVLKCIHIVREEFLKNNNITIKEMSNLFNEEISNSINSNEDFLKELKNNTKVSKSITWLLILTEWEMSDQKISYYKPTVEHIMPQNNTNWKYGFENIFLETDYNSIINKIGNYFIINGSKNSEASNYEFKKKKEIYKENTSPLFKNNSNKDIDISNQEEWTFEKIEKRTNAMIEYISKKVIF